MTCWKSRSIPLYRHRRFEVFFILFIILDGYQKRRQEQDPRLPADYAAIIQYTPVLLDESSDVYEEISEHCRSRIGSEIKELGNEMKLK